MIKSKIKSIFTIFSVSVMAAVFVVSCNKTQKEETVTETPEVTTAPEAPAPSEDLSKQDTIKITINSDDTMKYDLSEITVYEGQTVVLTLNHTGKLPVTAMGHNFVLLAQGTDMTEFANAATKAVDTKYIPEDQSNIIAHTKTIGGGESDTVTFKAPAKGTYDFMCSFPAHYAIMKGKFYVK